MPRCPTKGRRVKAQGERLEQRRQVKLHKHALADLTGEGAEDCSDEEDEVKNLQLHYNTVKSYISAIVKLWAFQEGRKVNPRGNPRTEQLNMLLIKIKTGTYEQNREEFADRLEGTLYDTYSQEDIPRHTRAAWLWDGKFTMGQALRTNVDFLLGTHTAKRPSEISNLELPDIFSFTLPQPYKSRQRGRATVRALVAVMRQGKENQEGKIEKAGLLRHRDPHSCAIGQLAFWYFWRFECEKEPLPDFSDRQLWYHTKVLRRDKKHPDCFLADSTARDWASRLLEAARITITKPRHGRRKVAATLAELALCPEQQIRRSGPWAGGSDALTGSYLTGLAPEFMRALADFEPGAPELYDIPRDRAKPPPELTSMIWPEMDHWAWSIANEGHADARRMDREQASVAMVEVMVWFREVLLQDAVFLRKSFPRHPIFKHPVFRSPEFAVFAQQVEDVCTQDRSNEDDWLKAEETNAFLTQAIRDLVAKQDHLLKEVQQGKKASSQDIKLVLAQIRDLANQTIHIAVSRSGGGSESAHAHTCPTTPNRRQGVGSGQTETIVGAKRRREDVPTHTATVRDVPDLPAKKQKTVLNGGVVHVPQHDLPDNLSSVEDLLRVWRDGTPYMPAVAVLEEKYGARWRPPAQRMYFSIRKKIMDELQLRAKTHGWPEIVAAADMDRERGDRSLPSYQKYLQGRK